jgi:hypothetical protein
MLLVCTDDVNLLRKNINSMSRNTEILLVASKGVGLEVIAEKTICTVLATKCRTEVQNREFACLGMRLINENCMQGEIEDQVKCEECLRFMCYVKT